MFIKKTQFSKLNDSKITLLYEISNSVEQRNGINALVIFVSFPFNL